MDIYVSYSANDAYAVGLVASIYSICANSSANDLYHISVFYFDLSEQNIDKIKRSISGDNIELSFIKFDLADETEYFNVLYGKDYLSLEMYSRIFLPKHFPDTDKLIYLDCDTIVNCDIAELYRTELDDCAIGAVYDFPTIKRTEQVEKVIGKVHYFNSGVLLINIDEYLKCNIIDKALKFIAAHKSLICPDQDALNFACDGKVKLIDDEWNFQWGHILLNPQAELPEHDRERYVNQSENFRIIHYVSGFKPWNTLEGTGFSLYYWKYALRTEYGDELIKRMREDDISRFPASSEVKSIIADQFKNGLIGLKWNWVFFKNWLGHKTRFFRNSKKGHKNK